MHARFPSRLRLGSSLLGVATAVALALASTTVWAQPADGNPFGTSGDFGRVSDRENTRLMGTVFDTDGNPMSDVLIWVVNDNAPAAQARSRTRKTGNYLVRGMASLYTEHDVYGITARARFEKEGYQTVVGRMAISKNAVERMYPVMVQEGQTFDVEGHCAVLVGTVVNTKGKGQKGFVVEVLQDGEVLATSEPTKGGGEFEIVLWDVGAKVELVATGKAGESRTNLVLEPRPQPDILVPQLVSLVVAR